MSLDLREFLISFIIILLMDKVMSRGIKRFVRMKTYISMKKPIDVLVWYWYCYRVRDTSYAKKEDLIISIYVYTERYIYMYP